MGRVKTHTHRPDEHKPSGDKDNDDDDDDGDDNNDDDDVVRRWRRRGEREQEPTTVGFTSSFHSQQMEETPRCVSVCASKNSTWRRR